MSRPRTKLYFVTLTSALMLVADGAAAARPSHGSEAQLRQSNDCRNVAAALSDWAAQQVVGRYHPRRHPRISRQETKTRSKPSRPIGAPSKPMPMPMSDADMPSEMPAVASMASAALAKKEGAGPESFTGTNVQEVNVDEADLVKTDGRHIYVANDDTVLIFESWPAERTRMVARLRLADGAKPNQLYLYGDTLMVLSSVQLRVASASGSTQSLQGSRITYIDVSNRGRPAIQRHVDLQGHLQSSRLIGSDLYLVTNAPIQLPAQLVARGRQFLNQRARHRMSHGDLRSQVRDYLRESLTRAELNAALPRVRSRRIGGSFRPLLDCGAVYVPTQGAPVGLVTLTHLPLNRHEVPETIGVLAGGLQVYSSTEALYVASNNQIHKLLLNAGNPDLEPEYVGSGQVPGQILNQFSMSEHQGFLRVATTDGRGNNILVLGPNQQGGLEVVGSVIGLARGERIYSARMFGDKGYVVTFRRTDPLYTLDLTDPRNPRVVGELEINGFSSYIHPLDGGRLLTIGQDADSNGRQQGVHLQIFDVNDPAAPTRTHHHRFGQGAQSSAQNDHHALTYDPSTQTLAVPVNNTGAERFTGLMVFRIDGDEGFSELGRVSHGDQLQEYWRQRCRRQRARDRGTCNQIRRQTNAQLTDHPVAMLRSIVMDRYLYSLSFFALEVHDLDAMDETSAAVVLSAEPKRRSGAVARLSPRM